MSPTLGNTRPHLGPPRRTRLKRLGLLLGLVVLAYLVWPYLALWSLSRALADPDPAALASHVDLPAVRDELRRKLNKDAQSNIGTLSDPFLKWLAHGIHRLGAAALDELVTLAWVKERLEDGAPPGETLLSRVTYAFFDAPGGFTVALGAGGTGAAERTLVHVRMTLQDLRWIVTAVYY
jgi:hypothetical protein